MGIEYEADLRQADKLIREFNLMGLRVWALPGRSLRQHNVMVIAVYFSAISTLRSIAGMSKYVSSDRSEIQYVATGMCLWMAYPTERALAALKRLGRVWERSPRLACHFPWHFSYAFYKDSRKETGVLGGPGRSWDLSKDPNKILAKS